MRDVGLQTMESGWCERMGGEDQTRVRPPGTVIEFGAFLESANGTDELDMSQGV